MQKKKFLFSIAAVMVCAAIFTAAYITFGKNNVKSDNKNQFTDVKDTDWFCEDINFVFEKELMNGTSDVDFSPYRSATRGMIVTVLWRMEGEPGSEGSAVFKDVELDKYYYNAVKWAYANKLVDGFSDDYFVPEDEMTREQLAAVLLRYARFKGYDTTKTSDLSGYYDSDKIKAYAVEAFKWANAEDIITGISSNELAPEGKAERAQIAAILHRFYNRYITEAEKATETVKEDETNSSNKESGRSANGGNSAGSIKKDDTKNEGSDNPTEIVLDKIEASPGDKVRISAKVNNNPGILGMTLSVNFDDKDLRLESVENGEAFKNILEFTASKKLGAGSRFVWDGIDIGAGDIKDGTILVMNFIVSDQAAEGDHIITFNYVPGDIVDNSLANIDLTINDGCIKIK